MTTAIELELQKAAKVKPGKLKPDEYMVKLVEALDGVPQAVWEDLSADAQGWANAAIKAHSNKRPIPAFPDAEPSDDADGEGSADAATETEEMETTTRKATRKASEGKASKSAKGKPAKAAKPTKAVKAKAAKEAEPKAAKAAKATKAAKPVKGKAVKAAPKATAKAKGKGTSNGVRAGSKREAIVSKLKRGWTSAADIREMTGWPAVSIPQQAAGYDLQKRKEGGVVQYRIAA